MLHKRVENWLNPDKVRYLMWDSSPQFGRDYQMALVQEVKKADLPVALGSLLRMESLFVGDAPDFDNNEAVAQTRADMDILRKKVCLHAVPAVLIGFGAVSFSHKLWSLLHAIRLETFSESELCDWAGSVLSVAADYGVERLLVDLESVHAQDVVGWFEDTSDAEEKLLAAGPAGDAVPARQGNRKSSCRC